MPGILAKTPRGPRIIRPVATSYRAPCHGHTKQPSRSIDPLASRRPGADSAGSQQTTRRPHCPPRTARHRGRRLEPAQRRIPLQFLGPSCSSIQWRGVNNRGAWPVPAGGCRRREPPTTARIAVVVLWPDLPLGARCSPHRTITPNEAGGPTATPNGTSPVRRHRSLRSRTVRLPSVAGPPLAWSALAGTRRWSDGDDVCGGSGGALLQ